MDLILIRHGEPDLNAEDMSDPPLTPLGIRQAQSTADYLASTAIDHIVVSPQQRAQQTAAPLIAATGLTPQTDERVAEFDYELGSYLPPFYNEEMSRAEWARRLGELQSPEFHARVHAGVNDAIDANPSRTVAIVCHGGVISSYVRLIMQAEATGTLRPDHGSITRIAASRKGDRSLLTFNEHHWIPTA